MPISIHGGCVPQVLMRIVLNSSEVRKNSLASSDTFDTSSNANRRVVGGTEPSVRGERILMREDVAGSPTLSRRSE